MLKIKQYGGTLCAHVSGTYRTADEQTRVVNGRLNPEMVQREIEHVKACDDTNQIVILDYSGECPDRDAEGFALARVWGAVVKCGEVASCAQ